jgi:toxin ParE1/3/4
VRTVRWSEEAYADLEDIVAYIELDSSSSAQRVANIIYDEAESLNLMSHRGRLGREPGTRELPIGSLDYIMTYEVAGDAVFILRIHHGAQDLPRR